MNLLAIETTGAQASVAVVNEKKEIYQIESSHRMSHLQNLIPMIGTLLQDCGVELTTLSGIAVSEGPGSFTGIRIGIATAKALAQALNVPVIGVPTLRAFAWNVPEYKGLICPIFDARREQIYGGAYYWKNGQCMQAVADNAYSIEDFLNKSINALAGNGPTEKELLILGEGGFVYEDRMKAWWEKAFEELGQQAGWRYGAEDVRSQKASSVASLALEKWKKGEVLRSEDLEPVYIRKAEAQRKLDERLSEAKESCGDAAGRTEK